MGTPIISTADVLKKSQAVLDQTKAQGSKPFAGSSFDTPTYTSTSLSNPQTPMTLTAPNPTTGGTALAGTIQDTADAYTKGLQDTASASGDAKNKSLADLLKASMGPGKEELTANAYGGKAGVDSINTELTGINQRILEETVAERRRQEQIATNAGGMSSNGLLNAKQVSQDASTKRLADMSVIQMGIQGRYDSAKAIADRAVNVQVERDTAKQNALLTSYNDNKSQFTQDEQRAFESAQADRDRAIQDKKDALTKTYNLAIEAQQNGASTAVVEQMMQASTPEEALKLGGNYIGLLDREVKNATLAKMNADLLKTRAETASLNTVPVDSKYAGVINTILGSGKFTVQQASAIRNSIANGDDPFVVIKNNAKNIMGSTEATSLLKYEGIQDSMHALRDSLNKFYQAGGDTGIINGNFENVANKLGQVNDPKLATLAVEVQSQLQSYRNSISGTAYSDQEGKDIASVFPGINKSKELNDSIFVGRDNALQATIDGLYRNTLGNVYDTLKSADNSALKGEDLSHFNTLWNGTASTTIDTGFDPSNYYK